MNNVETIRILSEIVSAERLNNFHKVLNDRTRYITVVLEDIFQTHNASAVMRSCDCAGIHDLHMIESNYRYVENHDVSLGSSQWINKVNYRNKENNTLSAINKLKEQGYRIVATTPHTNDTELPDFDISKGKIALLFGYERHGLSEIALNAADEYVRIPMFGFTESYNISVSAAICLYHLTTQLRNSDIKWQLTDQEKEDILAEWLKTSVKDSINILKLLEKRASSV